MKILDLIKGVINKMFGKNTIENALKVDAAVSSEMQNALDLWNLIYKNKSPWINENVKSLNLGKAIAQEFARLITIEMKSKVKGSERADYIDIIYQKELKKLRRNVEYMCAKGGFVYKPYVKNDRIVIDCVQADMFFPTEFTDDKLTGAIFISQLTKGNKIYTRLEYQTFNANDMTHTIRNKVYVSNIRNILGQEISLANVPEWANIETETVITNIDTPLFVYIKVPGANNVDENSPLGCSVYADAIELIKDAEEQYARYKWEFEGSELAVEVDESSIRKDENGKEKLSKHEKRLYKRRNTSDATFWQVFSPNIREDELSKGLNRIFRLIEFHCQLAYGTISDPNDTDKTAEEIRSSKQRSYSTIADIQKSVQDGLEELIHLMDILCDLYELCKSGEINVNFEWDDSIVADRSKEFTEKLQMLVNGTMQKYEFRMWYFGEDEKTAKGMIEKTDDLFSDGE